MRKAVLTWAGMTCIGGGHRHVLQELCCTGNVQHAVVTHSGIAQTETCLQWSTGFTYLAHCRCVQGTSGTLCLWESWRESVCTSVAPATRSTRYLYAHHWNRHTLCGDHFGSALYAHIVQDYLVLSKQPVPCKPHKKIHTQSPVLQRVQQVDYCRAHMSLAIVTGSQAA